MLDALCEIQSGDILAFSAGKPYSRLIQRATRSPYSHVGMALWMGPYGRPNLRRLCCLEAIEPGGVRVIPLPPYLEDCRARCWPVAWYGILDASLAIDTTIDFALAQWGQRYASPRQFALSWGPVTRRIRRALGLRVNLDNDPQRWFCSELMAAALQAGGAALPGNKIPATMSPGDVIGLRAYLVYRRHLVTR